MQLSSKKFALALGIAIGLICNWTALACEDIAVVARDGRYIVASADDLSEKDVGSLWWLGIIAIDNVIPQSTLQRAGMAVELRVDPSSGEAHQSELVVLKDLERSQFPGNAVFPAIANDMRLAWWTDDSLDSELAVVRSRPGGDLFALYSQELERVNDGFVLPTPLGSGVSCKSGPSYVIGALRHRLVFDGESLIVDEIAPDPSLDFRSLGEAPIGCITVIGSVLADSSGSVDISAQEMALRSIDLATGEIGLEFRKKRTSAVVLFSGGTLLLEQERNATPEGDNGFRLTPTSRVRVIDVETGSVVRSAELDSSGQMSRLFCEGDQERLVMATDGAIYLVDLASLSVIASRQVPFDRFFVF